MRTTAFKVLLTSSVLTSWHGVTSQSYGQEAHGRPVTFDIPSQSLSSAIIVFGKQSGLQVSVASASTYGVRTSSVEGNLDPFSALSTMLSGTGVTWWVTDDGSVVVSGVSSDLGVGPSDGDTLEPIVVLSNDQGSGFQGTPDWVYSTPSSVSVISREAIANSGASETNELFNNVSGVFSGSTIGAYPTVSPNVRGLQDAGRVTISIDGARQNAQEAGKYGGAGSGSGGFSGANSIAYVDTAFVREIDITKKTDATSNNAGSLTGAVDFRLISADDIIQPGRIWGAEATAGVGSNAFDFKGSAIGSTRIGDVFSLTLGVSRIKYGEFEPGQNGYVEDSFTIQETGRKSLSTLAKLEAEFGDFTASVSWMRQQNDYSTRITSDALGSDVAAVSDTAVLDFGWNPDSTLYDLSGKLWLQTTSSDELREARSSAPETNINRDFTSFGFILENTSELSTRIGELSLNYGAEAFKDVANKLATSSTIEQNPLYEASYGSWTPKGRRDIASAYLNASLEPSDWFKVSGGVRYDWYRLKGTPTYRYNADVPIAGTAAAIQTQYDALLPVYVAELVATGVSPALAAVLAPTVMAAATPPILPGGVNGEYVSACQEWFAGGTTYTCSEYRSNQSETELIDRSDGAWLPSVTVELSPVDWFKPYASYSKSFRPPTISESFIVGSLSPGDKIGVELAPNSDLRPERGNTYEVGANISADGLLLENDSLRMKVSGFYREVDDYIVIGDYLSDVPLQTGKTFYSYVNLDGIARMRGLELEGQYDADFFWLGGSYTFMNVDWPQTTDTFSNVNTSTTGSTIFWNTTVPPKQKFTLDAGVRLFDRRLSLGARLNHAMPSEEVRLDNNGEPYSLGEAYTTLDAYGALKLGDHAVLRINATNLTDRRYLPINSSSYAPGRTFRTALQIQF